MNRTVNVSAALLATIIAVAGCSAHDQEKPAQTPSNAPVAPVQPIPSSALPAPPQARVQPANGAVPETSSVAPTTSAPTTSAPPNTTPKPSTTRPTSASATTQRAPVTTQPAKPSTTTPKAPIGNTLRIGAWSHGYVSAYGSQASLDACNVVEWDDRWFAGHDWCGYAFWAGLGVGQTITLTGKNAGTYTVTSRVYLPTQGGKAPQLPRFDIVLQTCKGSGTQLVLAQKIPG